MKTLSVRTVASVMLVFALAVVSAQAEPPPWEGCRAVSKTEYNSAKREFLLRTRFGTYLRTGQPWRRHYWYCHR